MSTVIPTGAKEKTETEELEKGVEKEGEEKEETKGKYQCPSCNSPFKSTQGLIQHQCDKKHFWQKTSGEGPSSTEQKIKEIRGGPNYPAPTEIQELLHRARINIPTKFRKELERYASQPQKQQQQQQHLQQQQRRSGEPSHEEIQELVILFHAKYPYHRISEILKIQEEKRAQMEIRQNTLQFQNQVVQFLQKKHQRDLNVTELLWEYVKKGREGEEEVEEKEGRKEPESVKEPEVTGEKKVAKNKEEVEEGQKKEKERRKKSKEKKGLVGEKVPEKQEVKEAGVEGTAKKTLPESVSETPLSQRISEQPQPEAPHVHVPTVQDVLQKDAPRSKKNITPKNVTVGSGIPAEELEVPPVVPAIEEKETPAPTQEETRGKRGRRRKKRTGVGKQAKLREAQEIEQEKRAEEKPPTEEIPLSEEKPASVEKPLVEEKPSSGETVRGKKGKKVITLEGQEIKASTPVDDLPIAKLLSEKLVHHPDVKHVTEREKEEEEETPEMEAEREHAEEDKKINAIIEEIQKIVGQGLGKKEIKWEELKEELQKKILGEHQQIEPEQSEEKKPSQEVPSEKEGKRRSQKKKKKGKKGREGEEKKDQVLAEGMNEEKEKR